MGIPRRRRRQGEVRVPKVYFKNVRLYPKEDIGKALELTDKGFVTFRAASKKKIKIEKSVLTRKKAGTVGSMEEKRLYPKMQKRT